MSGKPHSIYIESLAAAMAQHHRLRRNTGDTGFADGSESSPQQWPTTDAAIGRKNSGEEVIYESPHHPCWTLNNARYRTPLSHPSRWATRRRTAGGTERIVIQAFAEDAPHSLTLQVIQSAS
jgi:hypothetical protein